MTQSERFRFGKFDLPPEDRPSVQEVHDAIDEDWQIRREVEDDDLGESRVFQERARTSYLGDSHDDFRFCHFYYVSDTESSRVIRDGEEEIETVQQELVIPRVLYFEDGTFAYESLEPLVDHWVPEYIADLAGTNLDPEDYTFYNYFSQEMMRDFYDRWDKVTVFKFGEPDDKDQGFEGSSPLAEALNELTEDVSNQQFSGGSAENNLKGTDIVENAARNMNVLKLHGNREDDFRQVIISSGTFGVTWSETDWTGNGTTQRRAEEIRSRLMPVLQRLN